MSIEQDYYDFTKEAQTLINAKRFDEAVSLLQKSIKNMPAGWKPSIESDESLEIFFWNKSEFLSFVDYNRAKLNKSVFWRFPSYSKAHYQLAYIFSDQGNFEKALNEIEKGLILEPDQPRLLCEKAYVLGKMNDLETSLSYLQKAINSRPWNTVEQKIHALRDMAVTQTNLERFDEALDAINEALKIDPSSTELKRDFDYIKSLRPEIKQSAKQPVQTRLLEEGQNLKIHTKSKIF